MLLVGIDDTDIVGSKGTNQLAKSIVRTLADRWICRRVVRHQLLDDPRVPYTSKNGSASILLEPAGDASIESQIDDLIAVCRQSIRDWFIEGSDPGLCVTATVPDSVVAFGRRAKSELAHRDDAFDVARSAGLHLEGLGGTNDGVIGALAAVGLATTGNDGRIVQLGDDPEDLTGTPSVDDLHARGVEVRDLATDQRIEAGSIRLPKKLRPNLRGHHAVLFVERSIAEGVEQFTAVKLP